MGEVGSGKSTLMAGILGEVPVSFPAAAPADDDNDGNGNGNGNGNGINSSGSVPLGARGEEASLAGSVNRAAGHVQDDTSAAVVGPRGAERERERVRVCYAAQAPWVMSGTVRENILFGLPMDLKRYR